MIACVPTVRTKAVVLYLLSDCSVRLCFYHDIDILHKFTLPYFLSAVIVFEDNQLKNGQVELMFLDASFIQ